MPDAPGELLPIARRYLICLNITCYRDAHGVHYFDPLWHKDLIQHVRYLENLTLASPCLQGEPPPDAIAWAPPLPEVQFLDLPVSHNLLQAILHLPSTAVRLWTAIGRAEIVHLGVAGWPIPFAWLASPLAALRGRFSVIVVESAPWRLRPGLPVTLKTRLRAKVFETLGRWCVNHSSLVIVTQEEYRKTLLTAGPGYGHVIHASWLDEESIISPAEAAESWRSKRLTSSGPLKLLFAGRLKRSKGVLLLLDAMRLISREGVPVELDILGQGELDGECRQACQSLQGVTKVSMLGVAPYNSAFFQILRDHHAVVVPSLSDEQPRIVYDAFSQAVPVLASDTPGLRDCVSHGRTGKLLASGEPADWAALFKWCLVHPHELEGMGSRGLETARAMTHEEMHRRRWRLLMEMLAGER
jgi:glycosyltransferase involved in cell wall biosynthesis